MAKIDPVKTFYLIDGHAQIFRAYYAPFRPLTSASGEPTKATFIFTQMLLKILAEKRPDYLAVALDVSDSTTQRRAFYPEYKANRDVTPEDLPPQIERIRDVLEALEIPAFSVSGQEADDVIATIAERLREEPIEVRVVSRDKDLHQLLTDRVRLWDPVKDEVLDPAALEAKLGYRPEDAVEIQTLSGDSTDNVPGVPGVGPKKAAALIRKYGSADEVLAHAEELTPKLRQNVLASRETIGLSRRLVTLNRAVDLDLDLERCRAQAPSLERIAPLFEELGFRRLLESLRSAEAAAGSGSEGSSASPVEVAEETDYRLVDTPEALEEFRRRLAGVKRFAIDTETTSLRAVDADLVGLSFSWKSGQGWYLPVRSRTARVLDPERTLEALRPFLTDPSIEKRGQNIKYDLVVLRSAGVELQGVEFDSMVASYLVEPTRRRHSMDFLARDILQRETIPISRVIGKGREELSMLDADMETLHRYAAEDADITWRLCEALEPRLAEVGVEALFRQVEMPLVEAIADMEHHGVTIDEERLAAISEQLAGRAKELRHEIWAAAGREFNVDSPRQLAEVLFDEQGLRVVKKTKTSRSTDASVLETLEVETAHPLPRLVLDYREIAKLRGTYVDPLPAMVSKRTGRIHASFHQAVTATGRLSSSEPNLQNIPVRTEQGRQIRRAFVPRSPDEVLITADYSQIELRILAHLSKDPALLEAFRGDRDVHAFVASQIWGVPLEAVTREQRSRAKAVNFGIIYGQGAFGLARSLRISRTEAAEFIRAYKERYAGIAGFVERCVEQAEREGLVRTMLGRVRPIPEIRSRNRAVRSQGERLAVNTVVQGSAADMIKVAMVRLRERVRREDLPLRVLIQVHDELVAEAPAGEAERVEQVLREEMEGALPLEVPVRVDVGSGRDWLEGKA